MSDAAVMALIALVGSVGGLMFQFLTKRDQLKFDTKLALLEQQQKKCEEDSVKKDRQIEKLESNVRWLARKDEEDKAELVHKIDEIKKTGDSGAQKIPPHTDIG